MKQEDKLSNTTKENYKDNNTASQKTQTMFVRVVAHHTTHAAWC